LALTLILITLFCSLFLVLLLKLVNLLISESSSFNREELSAFECGFDTHRLSRIPFSLRYFFLTLIFLLFDLEIILLVFSPSIIFRSSFLFRFVVVLMFLLVLLVSLFYELSDGTLE
jgi:NADH:ubiquinone oxidoreductase subunit 3 (subunit A)